MSSQPHIGRAVAGALALARFDRKGMEHFDLSYDGFWRSFLAVLLTLPVAIATAVLWPAALERLAEVDPQYASAAKSVPRNMAGFAVTKMVSFVAGWVFFPLAMIWIARMLNLGSRYVPLVVAFNWSRIVTGYALIVPLVLFGTGLAGAEFFALLQLAVYAYIGAYRWFVIRCSTGVPGMTAFGLMLFSFLGTILVEAVVSQVYWLFEPGTAVTADGNT